MIELVTGLPGSGKTLSTIWRYKLISERDNRPVYYHGIKDLALPWIELQDPTKWMEVEPNAIVIIDECQRTFRPASPAQGVPAHVAALETHRHDGIDLVLLTQQPMLVHRNVRELVGHHLHVVRAFGMSRSVIHEWDQCRDNPRTSRKDSRTTSFVYPKEAYTLYKSAEVHTHKRAIPFRVWIMLLSPFVAGVLLWIGYQQMSKVTPGQHQVQPDQTHQANYSAHSVKPVGPMTQVDYMDSYKPRLSHMPHTALRYDAVTAAKVAPRPAACVSSASKGCKCYTQQGTPFSADDAICREIVAHGFFVDWESDSMVGSVISDPDLSKQKLN